MKYPLSKNEWKWFIIGILMIAGMTVGFGWVISFIFQDETFLIMSAVLGTAFIYIKLIMPFLERI